MTGCSPAKKFNLLGIQENIFVMNMQGCERTIQTSEKFLFTCPGISIKNVQHYWIMIVGVDTVIYLCSYI